MSPLKPPSSTQNHSQLHNQCYFPPIFSARETRTHVNRSFLLTQPFSHSNSYFYSFVPNVTHCGIVYLNLLYVLLHALSVFINSLFIISFCNLLAAVYYKLLGAYVISFANFVPIDLIYNKISPSLLLLLCYSPSSCYTILITCIYLFL